MKKIFTLSFSLFLLFSGINVFAGNPKNATVVHSISLSTNNINELKHIQWNQFREIFKHNAPNDSIKIEITYKTESDNSTAPGSSSITISAKDTSSNINVMIKKLSSLIEKTFLNSKN